MSGGPFTGAVNAHLRKALALVEQCQALRSSDGSRLTQEALIEGSCFQLQLAKTNLLREIAENYQSPDAAQINSSDDLAAALSAIDKAPQELTEIQVSQQEGWMGAMDSAYAALISNAKVGKAAVQSAGLIQTKQLNSNELDFAGVESWANNLKELVDRQREMMVEC